MVLRNSVHCGIMLLCNGLASLPCCLLMSVLCRSREFGRMCNCINVTGAEKLYVPITWQVFKRTFLSSQVSYNMIWINTKIQQEMFVSHGQRQHNVFYFHTILFSSTTVCTINQQNFLHRLISTWCLQNLVV